MWPSIGNSQLKKIGMGRRGMRLIFKTAGAAVAPQVADQSFDYGEFSLLNNGFIQPVNTGEAITSATITNDPSGLFKVNTDGSLGPIAAGLVAGTYPVTIQFTGPSGSSTGIITVTSVPGYSVGDDEWAPLLAAEGDALNGRIVYGRENSFPGGVANNVQSSLAAARVWPAGLTLSSHDATKKANFRRIRSDTDHHLTLQSIILQSEFDTSTDTTNTGLLFLGIGTPWLTIDDCVFESSDVAEANQDYRTVGTGVYSGDGLGGGNILELHFDAASNPPDLSDVAVVAQQGAAIVLGQQTFTDSTSQWMIDSVVNPTTVIIKALSQSGASPAHILASSNEAYGFGNIKTLRGIAPAGSLGEGTYTISNTTFRNLGKGPTIPAAAYVDIYGCTFDRITSDFIQMPRSNNATKVDVFNNIFGSAWGLASDPQNPHVDGLQTFGPNVTSNSLVPCRFYGNRFINNGPRTGSVQMFFNENYNPSFTQWMKAEHNIGLSKSRHGVTGENTQAGSTVRGNTFLRDNSTRPLEDPDFEPQINISDLNDSSMYIQFNAVGSLAVGVATEGDNRVYGSFAVNNTDAIYTADFEGATYDALTIADVADLMARTVPRAGGVLSPANKPGIGAQHGYWDYNSADITTASTAPWDATGWDPVAITDITGAAINTAVTSGLFSVSGVGANGAAIFVYGGGAPRIRLTNSADVELVGWQDAGQAVFANDTDKIEIECTTGGTALVTETVTVVSGSVEADWTVQTGPGAFAAVAVDNQGTAYGANNSFATVAASKTGHASMWFYNDGVSWPAAAEMLHEFRTAGGNPRFDVKTASSGRLSFSAKNSANANVLSRTFNTGQFGVKTWYNLLISWDLNVPICQVYVNDVEVTAFGASTTTDDFIEAMARASTMGTVTGTSIWNGWITAPSWDFVNYLDLSITANRRNYIQGDGKPADATAYGTPVLRHDNALATFMNNTGSGADLTLTGTLIAAGSSPSD